MRCVSCCVQLVVGSQCNKRRGTNRSRDPNKAGSGVSWKLMLGMTKWHRLQIWVIVDSCASWNTYISAAALVAEHKYHQASCIQTPRLNDMGAPGSASRPKGTQAVLGLSRSLELRLRSEWCQMQCCMQAITNTSRSHVVIAASPDCCPAQRRGTTRKPILV